MIMVLSVLDPPKHLWNIGKLLYPTLSRPDLSYSVQVLSQCMDKPQEPHLQAAFRILCYLKSIVGQGLFLSSTSPFYPKAFFDADWAACSDSPESVTSYSVFIGDFLVS